MNFVIQLVALSFLAPDRLSVCLWEEWSDRRMSAVGRLREKTRANTRHLVHRPPVNRQPRRPGTEPGTVAVEERQGN